MLWADALRYTIDGVGKEVKQNIRAYLGKAPAEPAAVEQFLDGLPARITQALETLGYYQHTLTVNVDRERNPWTATLLLTLAEPVRYSKVDVEIAGAGREDAALLEVVKTHAPAVGAAVHHGRYEVLKRELQQVARRRGYFDAQIQEKRVAVDVSRGSAALTLVFHSGRRYAFGPVSVDNSILDAQLLARLLPFESGDPYEQQLLLDLRQRLLRLGYFAGVTVLPDLPERSYPTVPVRIEVTAAPRHSYELGVGFSTDTRQRLSLTWQSPRLNRWGHSQETAIRWSPINPQARATYSIPLGNPASDVLQIIGRLENNEFGDLESEQREFRLRRERTTGTRVSSVQARLLKEQWGVFSKDFDANFALAGASYASRARRGNAVDPRRGLSQFYSAEVASADLGSDEDLLRLYASLTGLRTFGERWRVVARGEAAALWTSSDQPDQLPPSLAFFAGGDNSLRGFAYQSVGREVGFSTLSDTPTDRALVVGGTRLLTGSLELQRYFNERWRGALFVDVGDAFDSGDFSANVGVGFGVHYLSPVGALRLELANPVTESGGSWRVHVNIGAEF